MVIAMFVRGPSLPSRGELVEQRLPYAPRARRLWQSALLGTAAAVVALIVLPYDFRQALITPSASPAPRGGSARPRRPRAPREPAPEALALTGKEL
jgi:hypothetical protein